MVQLLLACFVVHTGIWRHGTGEPHITAYGRAVANHAPASKNSGAGVDGNIILLLPESWKDDLVKLPQDSLNALAAG
jgi:hypothetical protein